MNQSYLAAVNGKNMLCKFTKSNELLLQTSESVRTFMPKMLIRIEKRPLVNLQCKNNIVKFKFRFNEQADQFQAVIELILSVSRLRVLAQAATSGHSL